MQSIIKSLRFYFYQFLDIGDISFTFWGLSFMKFLLLKLMAVFDISSNVIFRIRILKIIEQLDNNYQYFTWLIICMELLQFQKFIHSLSQQQIIRLMDKFFTVRNVLTQSSFEVFAQYLTREKDKFDKVDFISLLKQAYIKQSQKFMDYVRLIHKFYPDVIFENIVTINAIQYSVLEQICLTRKAWELQQLIRIDRRIIKDFDQQLLNFALINAYQNKNIKNGRKIIQVLLRNNTNLLKQRSKRQTQYPLIQAIRKNHYEIALYFIQNFDCIFSPNLNYSQNQFHVLFNNCNKKYKDKDQILKLVQALLYNNVNINQENKNGKSALSLCPKFMQAQVQNIIDESNLKFKSTSSKKQSERHKHQNSAKNDRGGQRQRDRGQRQKKNDRFSPKSKPQYSNKVKSEFGGRDQIKANNSVLKSNINRGESSFSPSNSSNQQHSQKISIKIQSKQELKRQAAKAFQKNTKRQSQTLKTLKKAKQKQQKSKVITSQELKYYLKQQIIMQANKIKGQYKQTQHLFNQVIQKIKIRLKQKLPIKQAQIFGSFATQLCLSESDIDLVIIAHDQNQYSPEYLLQKAHECLLQMKDEIKISVYLDKASVPIIKAQCTEQYHSKHIDITFQNDFHNGLESVRLINYYKGVYPQLENLIFILKKFIYTSKLFAPYSGGLSSYALILMIVSYIQGQHYKNSKSWSEGPQAKDVDLRVAVLLIGFLKFYGFKMDYVMRAIVVYDPQLLQKTEDYYKGSTIYNNDSQYDFQAKLVIYDPLLATNNVGKSTRKIAQIRMAFQLAYISIHTNKTCGRKRKCGSYLAIKEAKIKDIKYIQNVRPCCLLKRMFKCTDKFDLAIY